METISDSININLLIFKANENRNYHTIITSGMGLLPANVSEDDKEWKYTELMMYLPSTWPVSKENVSEFNKY
nr:suppressor of fused domain protein [Brevibacillus laterosporus]